MAHSSPKKDARKAHPTPSRQPMLLVICGETGIGKTHRSLLELYQYLKDNPTTGKVGRKMLAFDANGDDFPMFRTVALGHIRQLRKPQARRILPINPDGSMMTLGEKRDVVEQMVRQFRNGLLILEDVDKYMVGAKGQTVVGLLTTNRHAGLDICCSHQSIAKISTTQWQNLTYLRLHHQVDDVKRYKDRIPNYFIVRIANHIVNEQYDRANIALARGEISQEEYRYYRSFFVYVDMRTLRIRGCTKAAFIRAVKKYIDTEDQAALNTLQQERDWDGNKRYPTRKAAELKLIQQYLRHFDPNQQTPFGEA